MNFDGDALDDDDEVSQNSILDNDLMESLGVQHHNYQQNDEQSYIGGQSHVMHNNQSSMLDAEHLVMGMNQDEGSENEDEEEENEDSVLDTAHMLNHNI